MRPHLVLVWTISMVLVSPSIFAEQLGDPDAVISRNLTVPSGSIGIGTSTPGERLHVRNGSLRLQGISGNPEGFWEIQHNANSTNDYGLRFSNAESTKFAISPTGSFTVYDTTFNGGNLRFGKVNHYQDGITATNHLVFRTGSGDTIFSPGNAERMRIKRSGEVGIGTAFPAAQLHVAGDVRADGNINVSGELVTGVLEITGGSDLAELFHIRSVENHPVLPGMVVCIDPENPGQLMVSSKPYDRTVAGVISGAGELRPGMLMGQRSSIADGQYPVALSGRVFVMAQGPVQVGDLLTTGYLPGHAATVTEHDRARGAILGKAMTPLNESTGLVLILITLQ